MALLRFWPFGHLIIHISYYFDISLSKFTLRIHIQVVISTKTICRYIAAACYGLLNMGQEAGLGMTIYNIHFGKLRFSLFT